MPDEPIAITDEALVQQLVDRLDTIQKGIDASVENQCALRHARACQEWLVERAERAAKREAATRG